MPSRQIHHLTSEMNNGLLTAHAGRRLALFAAVAAITSSALSAERRLPPTDLRTQEVKTLDTARTFPPIASKAEWEQRAGEIREQALVSCGLWPMPAKPPVNATVFGRIERDGYSVEKVLLETYPGFFLAGNLYRPAGAGPFPAILNPHGHWANGRLADTKDGSIAARCINFARQGMIAFSYDMAGYNDTMQIGAHRDFALEPRNALWSVSLMGLQTWNSIRALDFLESLPEVDRTRLACTGESGGGTQTFMLGAIDARLASQAPIVMVSHTMQGGCLCENASGLRIDYSNMEIAAVPAPRPQILIAATGDWTKTTMTVEGPSIERIYKLFNAADHLRYQIFEAPHNYNQATREAVYGWFGRWLRNQPGDAPISEQPYTKEPDEALRVAQAKPPEGALNREQLIDSLIAGHKAQFAALAPHDAASLDRYKKAMSPAWRHTLQVSLPEDGLVVETGEVANHPKHVASKFHLGRDGKGDRVPALLLSPLDDKLRTMVVLVHPEGMSGFLDANHRPAGLAQKFVEQGMSVLLLDTFLTGARADEAASNKRDHFAKFFSTYNRTDLQERVQDIITAAAFAHRYSKGSRSVILCGTGRAGLWALLAAPAADGVIADCDALDPGADAPLLARDLFVPGFHAVGGFQTAALLAAPKGLLLHNVAAGFPTETLERGYEAAGAEKQFTRSAARLDEDAIVRWAIEQARMQR